MRRSDRDGDDDRDEDTAEDRRGYARGRVAGPAWGLIATSGLSLDALLLALGFDLWLLVSGTARELERRGAVTTEAGVRLRLPWTAAMVAAGAVTLAGGVQMLGLRGLAFTRFACVLALVPCLGPCFVAGAPFGIWGLVALGDRHVSQCFRG